MAIFDRFYWQIAFYPHFYRILFNSKNDSIESYFKSLRTAFGDSGPK